MLKYENMNDCLFILWLSKSDIQRVNQKIGTNKYDDKKVIFYE